ncbi:equilibrative nucleobase transporter 1-like [Rhinoraja longicauda]
MGPADQRIKLLLTFATGVVECVGFAGVIYGWPSLVFVLKNEDYFADLCNSSDAGPWNVTGQFGCVPQDQRFALVFTIGGFVLNFGAVASGFLLDSCGIMTTRFLAIFLYTAGTLIIAFSAAASALLLFPALALIGAGGVMLLITNIKVGNLFGRKRATVITVYTGAFSSAPVTILLVKVAFEAGFSLRAIFLFTSCLSVVHVLRTVFLIPWKHIPYPLPEGFSYGFPSCHFGKLYGTTRALAAIVSLLQYPFFIIINGPLQDDPLYMNVAFVVLVSLTFVHPINVYIYCQRADQQKGVSSRGERERERERERSRVMGKNGPGDTGANP